MVFPNLPIPAAQLIMGLRPVDPWSTFDISEFKDFATKRQVLLIHQFQTI